jgi:anti-sigma B factor antagonist
VTTIPSRFESESERFRCEVEANRESVRVVPFGELDLDTVGELAEQLRELQEAGFRAVVLDLRNLTFMDSSGVHLLVATDQLARRDGTTFAVITGSAPIQRLVEIVGAHEILTFRAT